MALVLCTECKAEISDKADACPKCGNPSDRKNLGNHTDSHIGSGHSPTKWWLWIPLAGVAAFLAFGFSIPKHEADAMAQGRACREMFAKGLVATMAECNSLEANLRSQGSQQTSENQPPVMGRWEREALEEAQRKKRDADAAKGAPK